IKVSVSGGIMSHTGPPGAQQYSDEELRAIVDEAHRRGLKVAAHAHGDDAIRAAVEAGIDCIEHGSLASDQTLRLMVERGTFLVATTVSAELIDADDRGRLAPGLLADVIAVPGDPLSDIGVTEKVQFVMKAGRVHRAPDGA